VDRSKPFIVARLLCCLFVDLIWRNLLYLPVERETLFRLSLASKGVQKLLLNELETSEGDCEALRAYVERYHESDKRAAVLEERLKTNTGTEIMFSIGLVVGGALIGWAPTLWDGSSKGPIALAIGVILVAGSGIAKAVKL
jgi:hypothetical protein